MKKRYLILGLSALLLSACGGNVNEDTSDPTSQDVTETTETTDPTSDDPTSVEDQDFEGLVFKDATVTYDGNPHTIVLSGAPADAAVEYVGDHEFTNVGVYSIKVKVTKEGYKDAELTAKLKIIPAAATQAKVVDDFEDIGDSDLASDWVLEYYGSTGWVTPSSASIKVAQNGVFDGKSTMRMNMTHQGAPFKVTKEIEKDRLGYTGFALDVCSDDVAVGASTKVQFQLWFKDLPLPADYAAYKDTYITYTLDTAVSTNWTHYEVPFTDETINIASGAIPVEALQVIGLSVADLMFYLDKVAVLVTPNYMDNGPKSYAYIDNVKLMNVSEKKVETKVKLGKKYTALSSNGTVVVADILNETQCSLTLQNLEIPVIFNGSYTVTNSDVVVTIPTGADKSVVFNLKAKNNGATLEVNGMPTGDLPSVISYIEHFQFTKLDRVTVVDNFESYSETGQGVDRVHTDPSQVSGLRAAYYGEVYNTDTSVAAGLVGDQNWKLMNVNSWTDYIALESNGHEGKAMNLKNNADWQTRYLSFGLATGGAQPIGRGEYISFFVKGSAAQTMKFRAYYENRVSPANQTAESGSCAYKANIEITTEWTQVLVPLEANREVYGIMITPTKANARIYVDDIELIGLGNPHEKYVAPVINTISDGNYYLWNGDTDVYTASISDGVTQGSFTKLGLGSNFAATVTMASGKLTIEATGMATIEADILENETFKVTSVTGNMASMLEASLMGKTFKKYDGIDMNFNGSEYSVGGNVPGNWKKEKYGSAWESGGSMYVKSSNSGNKFINFYCGYGYSYRYTYTPDLPIGPVNNVSFKYANDWGGADIKVKVKLIDMGGNEIFLVGDSNNWETIPNGAGDRMNDGMLSMNIELPALKNIKSFCITVNTAKSGDNYLYIDDLFIGYVA